jgi:hypothetical protein
MKLKSTIIDYIVKSRSEFFCAKPEIEDRDEVEAKHKRPSNNPHLFQHCTCSTPVSLPLPPKWSK